MSGIIYSYAFCSKRLTQFFVGCNSFNKGEINEVPIEWYVLRNKRRTDKQEPN